MSIVPVDQAVRDRVERGGLGETLFVEAGAGTGKTHELVERVVQLVLTGIRLSSIAAITFTEAAAAELRDRIREAFERRLAGAAAGSDDARCCEQALADIDEAAIGTLHGFCLRILSEHPLAVGLPPRVEILDEVTSQLVFEDRWERFVDQLYVDAPDLVTRAWVLGIEITAPSPKVSLKDVAGVFEDSWDRLETLVAEPLEDGPLPVVDLSAVRSAVDDIRALVLGGACADANDTLLARIATILPVAEAALAEDDPLRALGRIAGAHESWKSSRKGRKTCWVDVEAARAAVDALGEAGKALCDGVTDDVLRRLTARLARFSYEAAEARRDEGRLVFHDLLVLARRLVRTSPEARASLYRRYQRLLLDEFQDTDPIQIEVAALIAAAVADDPSTTWDEVVTDPGRLFFVGDPKQSIYRFRRADIGLFLAARDHFGGVGSTVSLTQNFRTVEPVLDWVNAVFGRLMAGEAEGAQAEYQPLAAARRPDGGADHRVVVLGGLRTDVRADQLRVEEAAAVAGAVANVRDDPGAWPVFDERTAQWRHPRMADVTILVPARTSLRQLEDALDARGLPYRVATGTLVYDTQEVRDALAALRAIDDPGDAIALVAALRSPLYACSDVDLLTWKRARGHWDVRRDRPDSIPADHPVAEAVAHLRSLWEQRWWLEPSALLTRLLDDRRAFALGFAHRRPREVWRRLRFIVDQARAFEEAGGGDLRAFLAWAELQRHEGTRVHEPLLAETDDDAVSILTIHGAKGLEFPITVVSGTTTLSRGGRRGVQVLWEDGRPEIKLSAKKVTEHFDRLADFEAEMDTHERKRLLYVACTRARDHLIVSGFHTVRGNQESYGKWLSELSAEEPGLVRSVDIAAAGEVAPVAAGGDGVPAAVGSFVGDGEEWAARREALLARQRTPVFVSATSIAHAPDVDRREDDGADPETGDDGGAVPWRRGRAGTAIGSAVHATLQFLERGLTGADLETRVRALAEQHAHLEAVPDAADLVATLTLSALRAPSVVAANAAERSWREIYVAAPLSDDRAIEGYIDLLYETPDGLVLVDYKTDTVRSPAEADDKAANYFVQTAAYAVALEQSTGLPVVGAHLVFCTTGEPVERTVPDLEAAKADVRRRAAALV